MKLKQRPEDFQVEELTDLTGGDTGDFGLYQLRKTGWTTPDAIAAIRRRWQLNARRVSYGGLKDRHATTSQFISVYRGPKRNLSHQRITLTYLGQVAEPFTAAQIRANRFDIVMRSLSEADIATAETALSEIGQAGLPNYFDDQRFGSVGGGNEFVAREMVLGRFERALWLALAAPYEHDRAEAKREKQILREGWGDWVTLKSKLPRGHARSLVDYLVTHPADFKGAVARMRPELQGLYLSAYQSYLWNRILSAWLRAHIASDDLVAIELKLGQVVAPTRVPDSEKVGWESLTLPLPSARLKPAPDAPWLPIVEQVLKEEELTLPELRIRGMQKPFFSRGERAGCVRPAELSSEAGPDEFHRGRAKLRLRFDLPRGSYATMLVKRITSADARASNHPAPAMHGFRGPP